MGLRRSTDDEMAVGSIDTVNTSVAASAAISAGASAAAQDSSAPTGKAATASPGIYASPIVRVDNSAGLVILEYRDPRSGEVQVQYPSQEVVRQYRDYGSRLQAGDSSTVGLRSLAGDTSAASPNINTLA